LSETPKEHRIVYGEWPACSRSWTACWWTGRGEAWYATGQSKEDILLAGLKQQRRHNRALRATMDSLRGLRLDR
jgi:hypothetical protein